MVVVPRLTPEMIKAFNRKSRTRQAGASYAKTHRGFGTPGPAPAPATPPWPAPSPDTPQWLARLWGKLVVPTTSKKGQIIGVVVSVQLDYSKHYLPPIAVVLLPSGATKELQGILDESNPFEGFAFYTPQEWLDSWLRKTQGEAKENSSHTRRAQIRRIKARLPKHCAQCRKGDAQPFYDQETEEILGDFCPTCIQGLQAGTLVYRSSLKEALKKAQARFTPKEGVRADQEWFGLQPQGRRGMAKENPKSLDVEMIRRNNKLVMVQLAQRVFDIDSKLDLFIQREIKVGKPNVLELLEQTFPHLASGLNEGRLSWSDVLQSLEADPGYAAIEAELLRH